MKLDYFIYRLKYRFGQYLPLSVPVDVSLELSSQCNMQCEYCYHNDQEHLGFTKGLMPLGVGERIIKQSATLGVHSLKFNWKGESTINPNFYRLTKIAKDMADSSIFIDRLTNSNFKFATNREDIFRGLCNQTKVKISYDSFRPEVFEKQRYKGIHALTTANINKFYNYPDRKNTEMVIQAVRTKLNYDEDIEDQVKKLWPEATISIRDMVGGRVNKDLTSLQSRKRDFSDRQTCQQAHVRIIFNHEGKAFPCCPDIKEELCLGDINKSSVWEIFNGYRAKYLRKSLKNKSAFHLNPCATCSSFETYKGYKPTWNS